MLSFLYNYSFWEKNFNCVKRNSSLLGLLTLIKYLIKVIYVFWPAISPLTIDTRPASWSSFNLLSCLGVGSLRLFKCSVGGLSILGLPRFFGSLGCLKLFGLPCGLVFSGGQSFFGLPLFFGLSIGCPIIIVLSIISMYFYIIIIYFYIE